MPTVYSPPRTVENRRRTFEVGEARPRDEMEKVRKLEDKEVCLDCVQKVVEEGIECDYCTRWYHIKCQKVENRIIKVVEKGGVRWYCSRCEGEVRKINEQVSLKENVAGIE